MLAQRMIMPPCELGRRLRNSLERTANTAVRSSVCSTTALSCRAFGKIREHRPPDKAPLDETVIVNDEFGLRAGTRRLRNTSSRPSGTLNRSFGHFGVRRQEQCAEPECGGEHVSSLPMDWGGGEIGWVQCGGLFLMYRPGWVSVVCDGYSASGRPGLDLYRGARGARFFKGLPVDGKGDAKGGQRSGQGRGRGVRRGGGNGGGR